ncbi:MAG: glycosyltransferase family 39 protein, partial [Candidatus Methanomethylicaceae archaeon]
MPLKLTVLSSPMDISLNRGIRHRTKFDWALLPILLLALLLRTQHLTALPIFHDEALYLHWAQQTVQRHDLGLALNQVSTLHIWLLAGLYNLSLSGLWLGRFVSALVGFLTVALCYAIGRQLYRRDVAIVAAALYAVFPLTVFHDRVAQNDSLLAFFIAILVWRSISWAYYGRVAEQFVIVLVFGLAFLTKKSAALWIPVPFLAMTMLRKQARLKALFLRLIGIAAGFALAMSGMVWFMQDSNVNRQIAEQTLFFMPADILLLWHTN